MLPEAGETKDRKSYLRKYLSSKKGREHERIERNEVRI